jgi:hypothetical protein
MQSEDDNAETDRPGGIVDPTRCLVDNKMEGEEYFYSVASRSR